MGSDMERSQFFLNNASNSQQISDWVFKDIKFDYSRVSYDRKQELVEGAPNLAFYNRAVLSMKMARQSNPNLKFWATLKSDYDGYGTTNNLPDWIYTGGGHNGGSYEPSKLNIQKYARFLADYLKYMSDNDVAISVMSVVKEWSQVVSATNEVAVIQEIKRLLTTSDYAGVPEPEFSGPSTWGTKQAISILNSYKNQNALGLFKGISTHSYDNATEATWTTLINNANELGLSVWHTETGLGTGPTYGVELDMDFPIGRMSSRAMFYRSGMEGELFFEPWSRGIGRETRAIYFANKGEGERMRAYYIMKMFGNHAPAGAHYIPTQKTGLANVETMAFRDGNKLILWVMNSNEAEHLDTTLNINGEELGDATIERVAWFEGTSAEGEQMSLTKMTETSAETEINAKSVVAYVITFPEPQIAGDINNDGEINRGDITAFMAVYGLRSSDEGYLPAADFDNDGVISRLDYGQLYAIYRQQ
ncbi:dockerin type I domain-containing protein [Psychrosphaera algicola]|uniref:Dockerin type I domain-containing protein n=2 Tax=Psychrosphaera TaxID=907197 RepID=A0ABT5FCP5_9GAMM|nr:dockerin type I domain-containing protein [Psychrosphaera sp. G1-22]MDC2889315.1 dockerin type I domain-containing protein [Psychrosphaera sp. G1-22]